MPRKIDTPIIVARYGDKVAGWAGGESGGRLSGDPEWVASAKAASDAKLEFTLYGDVELTADIEDPSNPAGAFAALAWYAKERIIVKNAPHGMMESLGLLDVPEMVDVFEGYNGAITDEDRDFAETHFVVTIEQDEIWVPISEITKATTPQDLIRKFISNPALGIEPEDEASEEPVAEDEEIVEEPKADSTVGENQEDTILTAAE